MRKLVNGIKEFQRNIFPKYKERFQDLASRQNPEALLITCSDSRVLPELLTQGGPGDYFVYRNAGNIIPPFHSADGGGTLATIEYAVSVLRVKSLIICGHSDCGAMKGLLHPESVQHLPAVDRWLRQAERARHIVCECHEGSSPEEKLKALVEENVIAQLENVRTNPSVAVAAARGELELFGLYYDIPTGHVSAYDRETGQFRVFENTLPSAAPMPRFSIRAA